jgi:hypothetical protein
MSPESADPRSFDGLSEAAEPAANRLGLPARANLGSKEYPFPQLVRALAGSGGQLREDTALLIRAVAATVAPLPESHEELADSGEMVDHAK